MRKEKRNVSLQFNIENIGNSVYECKRERIYPSAVFAAAVHVSFIKVSLLNRREFAPCRIITVDYEIGMV